jgi:hypothetical protein
MSGDQFGGYGGFGQHVEFPSSPAIYEAGLKETMALCRG